MDPLSGSSSTVSRSNLNLEMLVFEERGKPEYPEKNLSEQGREPTTNSTHIWRRVRESNPGHIGGRRALSPLRHPCSPLCMFLNRIIYIEPGVKRVENWQLMWTMQLQTCLEKHVSLKHVCYKHASVLVRTQHYTALTSSDIITANSYLNFAFMLFTHEQEDNCFL